MKVIILGYGVRGRTYAKYALSHPNDYQIAAVADPVLRQADSIFPRVCADWRDALEVPADAAIIALPDKLHCEAAKAALAKGLHILLEKPVGCSWKECEEIRASQREAGRIVLTGYVLRFAEYYKRLRDILISRIIGDLVSIHHVVRIGFGKAAHAFCRGNWAHEASGTTTLVQKCSHDFDLIEWWTGSRRAKRISSFGSLVHWKHDCAPAGSAARCTDCAEGVRQNCPFDAVRLYCEENDLRYHFADTSDEAMRSMVETSRYGKCVYHADNDAVNRQVAIIEYDDGLIATLEMEAFSSRRERYTRFYGTRGEIVASGDAIRILPFIGKEQIIKFDPSLCGAHGGGDDAIMAAFANLVERASPNRYSAILSGSLESHRLAFLAETSRLTSKTVLMAPRH